MDTIKERKDVDKKNKWNVEALYSTSKEWEKEFEKVCRPSQEPHWPEILAFRGRLGEGAELLKKFLDLCFDVDRQISKLYTYAHMRYDEDLGSEENKKNNTKISTLCYAFGQELAWVEPELLSLSDDIIHSYLSDAKLKDYTIHLERIVRNKPHTLTSDKEELLALMGMPMSTASKSFGAFNNADLKFAPAIDSKGTEHELTHAKYALYLRSKDRDLRKNAFQSMHRAFMGFESTLCELINGHVQTHLFNMRARKFPSCLEAALFPHQIDPSVYTNLIATVRKHLPILHHYMKERRRVLKVDELHMYDLYVPLVEEVDLNYDYKTAEALVIDSVAPLGEEYQSTLENGLLEERWVDRYENLRKRSGAYSSGCYDSMPYILMNFQGTFRDLMTLAHEAGHSMHSFLSHKHQPYQYSSYSIFVAEVASTFNEELVFQKLLKEDRTKQEKAFLINQKVEDIRATLFRQTMFAEFELFIHTLAEESIPITPGLLKEKYRDLNREYFGVDVFLDNEIDIEWARIPHFYSDFYVYQYATGISAARALYEKVMKEGEPARRAYLNFLSLGCSNYPLDILEQAGVNMRDEEPISSTIKQFDHLVHELFKLI